MVGRLGCDFFSVEAAGIGELQRLSELMGRRRVDDHRPATPTGSGHDGSDLPSLVRVRILGRMSVETSLGELTVPQASVVAFLACNGPTTRTDLIDSVWSGELISESRLSNLISEVRAVIGRSRLPPLTDRHYRLRGVDVDRDEFLVYRTEGDGAASDGDWAAALDLYRSALALVSGPPLGHPSGRFWDWIDDQDPLVSELESIIVDVALAAAELGERLGRPSAAQSSLERGLVAAPFSERLMERLVAIHLEQGNRGLANRLVGGWEQSMARLDCGPPPSGPRRRLTTFKSSDSPSR